MPNMTVERRSTLLQALSLRSAHTLDQVSPENLFPIPEHVRAMEAEVLLIVGDRGAGKTELKNALIDERIRSAVARNSPNVRVPQGKVEWKIGWPLGAKGPDSTGWRALQVGHQPQEDFAAAWGAYLLRGLAEALTEDERSSVQSVLELASVNAVGVTTAHRQAGVNPTGALDALDARLLRENRWIFVAYDELDTVDTRWETLGLVIRGLVTFWANYARRWKRIRPKIFLRSDFFKHHRDVAGADVAKLAGNRVELQWSDANLYGALLKHIVNKRDASGGYALRDYFARSVKTRADETLGMIPVLSTRDEARPFVDRLASEWMGATQSKGLTFRWILDHLRDGNGRALPRSLVQLVASAAEIERDHGRAKGGHLLHNVSIRNALDKVSTEYVSQAKSHEFLWLEGLQARLQQDRNAPWQRRVLVRLLKANFDGQWSANGARPPGSSPEEVVDNLVELGILRARPGDGDKFDVPDLYLHGLDLTRHGGAAKG